MPCCKNGVYVPLVTDCDGTTRTMQAGESLRIGPLLLPTDLEKSLGTTTFSYTGTNLTGISSPAGTKTLSYTGSQLTTMSDTASGTLSTFHYTGSQLTSIVVTTL